MGRDLASVASPHPRFMVRGLTTTDLCIVRAAAVATVRRYYGKPWVWTVIHNSGGVRNMYGDLYQLSEGDYGPVRYLPTRQGHRGVAKPTGAGTRLAFNASDRRARGTSSGPGAGDAVAGEGPNVDSGAGPHTDGINEAAGAGGRGDRGRPAAEPRTRWWAWSEPHGRGEHAGGDWVRT